MEIFLPGLLVLLISALFGFMVLPRMGPVVLAVVCGISIVAVLLHHYRMFGSEYRLSTWQNGLAAYAPLLLIAVSILIVIAVAVSLFTGKSITETIQAPIEKLQSGIEASIDAMPSAASATNSVTSALNGVISPAKPNAAKPNNSKSMIPTLGFRASNV